MASNGSTQGSGWRWLLAGAFFAVILTASVAGAWWLRGRVTPTAATPTGDTPPTNPAMLKRGRLLYLTACQSCHGSDGRGDAEAATRMNPPPRNFAEGPWKHGSTPEAVRKVIRDGVRGTAMPGNASLSDADLTALTAYVLTLGPGSADRLTSEVTSRLRAAGFTPVDPPWEAPPLELIGPDGEAVSLTKFRGGAVLVHFWATDCVPCLAELPDLERMASALAPREDRPGLTVLAVCADETDREAATGVMRQHAPGLPVFVDPRGLAKLRYGAEALPCSFLIDARGRLVGTIRGRHAWSSRDLEAAVQAVSR